MERKSQTYYIIRQYLGRPPSTTEYHMLKKQVDKISKVNSFNKDTSFFC